MDFFKIQNLFIQFEKFNNLFIQFEKFNILFNFKQFNLKNQC